VLEFLDDEQRGDFADVAVWRDMVAQVEQMLSEQ